RRSAREQRQGALKGEERALVVDVHDLVEQLLGEILQWGEPGNASIEEQDVEPAVVPREANEQGVDVFLARGVGDQRLDRPAQLLTSQCDSLGVPAGDDAPRTFV